MDEMNTNERREMTRGMLEAAPSNALLDALGLRAPSGGPSGAPGDDTTLDVSGGVGHGGSPAGDVGHCGSRRAPGVAAPGVPAAGP